MSTVREQTVAKRLPAPSWKAHKHVAPLYKVQYHLLLLWSKVGVTHSRRDLAKYLRVHHHRCRPAPRLGHCGHVTLRND